MFQSPHYYYLVDDLDMQSKGHAICATLVSESNAFSMMPRLKPCNCVPGELWLKFSQYTSKNVLYPHCAITPYHYHCQDKNGTYQNNHFDVASTNISMWMALEPCIIIRRGFGQEKRIKKWLNIILMGRKPTRHSFCLSAMLLDRPRQSSWGTQKTTYRQADKT